MKEGFVFHQVSPSSPHQTFGMEGARILVRSLKCEKSHFAFYTLVIRFNGLHSVEAGRSPMAGRALPRLRIILGVICKAVHIQGRSQVLLKKGAAGAQRGG